MNIKLNENKVILENANAGSFELTYSEFYRIARIANIQDAKREIIEYLEECCDDCFEVSSERILNNTKLIDEISHSLVNLRAEHETTEDIHKTIAKHL